MYIYFKKGFAIESICYICTPLLGHAAVMELVDMPDLGSGAARRGGSTPFSRTCKKKPLFIKGFFILTPLF